MPFSANECFFYEDGLSHESSIAVTDDSDAAYQALIDREKIDPTFLGRVVEIDADGNNVYEDIPYPRVKEPPFPDFYLAYQRGRR